MLTSADKWILSKVNTLAKDVSENLEHYELGLAAQKIYDFLWDEFCDWYIEMVKPRLYNKDDNTREAALWTLKTVLINALKMLHPFMPYITEELFQHIQDEEESIMISDWTVQQRRQHKRSSTVDTENSSHQRTEDAASFHALYHRRTVPAYSGRRRKHHDFRLDCTTKTTTQEKQHCGH